MNEVSDKFELMRLKTTLDRVLNHQIEFKAELKQIVKNINDKFELLNTIITSEEKNRMAHVHEIKDKIHERINTILFSCLGGSFLFISGIIMWVISRKE